MATEVWKATDAEIAEARHSLSFHEDRLTREEFLDHVAEVIATARAESRMLRNILHDRVFKD